MKSEDMVKALKGFGYTCTVKSLQELPQDMITALQRVVPRWQKEYEEIMDCGGEYNGAKTPVPLDVAGFLEACEHADNLILTAARTLGQMIRTMNGQDISPYVTGSSLDEAFHVGYEEIDRPLRKATAQKAKPSPKERAIQEAIASIEDALSNQDKLLISIEAVKAELKELKSSYDGYVLQAQEAGRELHRARLGQAEQTLPFTDEPEPDDREPTPDVVPDETVNDEDDETPEEFEAPVKDKPIDQYIALDYLAEGEIQGFVGVGKGQGIPVNKLDALKTFAGGDTLIDLEKAIERHGPSWHKMTKIPEKVANKIELTIKLVRMQFPKSVVPETTLDEEDEELPY